MDLLFSGMVWKFFERIANQSVSLIVSIVLARLILPEQFGMIVMVSVFIMIADVFVSTGLSTALVQNLDSDELDFSSNFYLNLVLALVLYVILFFSSSHIAEFYRNEELIIVLRVLGLRLLVSAFSSIQQAYISKYMLFKNTAITTIVATLISAGIGIGMAASGYGVWALVGQQLSLVLLQVVMLSFIVAWRPSLHFSWERSKNMLKYSSNVLVANILDAASNQLRNLFIGRNYTVIDLAYYNRGNTYPQMLLNSINNSLHVVLFAAYAIEQENLDSVKMICRQAVKHGTFIIFPMMTGLAIVAKPLVLFMLTERWLGSVPYLRIACFTYATWIIQIVNQEAIYALGYANDFLKISILRTMFNLGILVIAIKYGVIAIAASAAIANLFSVFLVVWFSGKHFNYSFLELFLDIIPAITNSFFMAILVFAVSLVPVSLFLSFSLQVLIGAISYIMVSALMRNESLLWIIRIIKVRRKSKTRD